MISTMKSIFLSIFLLILTFKKGNSELLPTSSPTLVLYTQGDPEYTQVLVRKVYDNLTLVCELRGHSKPFKHVWNYLSDKGETSPLVAEPATPTLISKLVLSNLSLPQSGQYMCSVPPFSVNKYILVQTKGPSQCARGAFWCGARCVLPTYVCDGHRDCVNGEDETPTLCNTEQPCAGPEKLNCSSGRCISALACCRPPGSLCKQPSCCEEHTRYSTMEGYIEPEYPALYEDRHAPDDYGFIQSTIYTVTACALIFMLAAVLLVSAICKMHMKRAALRSYCERPPPRAQFNAQTHHFPPCYEASLLLDQEAMHANAASSPAHSVHASPARAAPQHNAAVLTPESDIPSECQESNPDDAPRAGFGLSRLGAIFASRYRAVPTQPSEVEMQDVRCNSLNSSPTRHPRTRLDNYRSPTYCDLNTDFYFTSPETPDYGRDLNYMATPIEFYRRRTMTRSPVERILDQISASERARPLTLHLGRFQLSIPRFGRRTSSELGQRPDTPNVAELNIDDLDFVRLNSNETYTLNGRTIRLLGADFENYPAVISNGSVARPPPYNEAMRYKLYGPPPEYLSRDALDNDNGNVVTNNVDEQARSNVEMPPRYEDLATGVDGNANVTNEVDNGTLSLDNALLNIGNLVSNTGNALLNATNVAGNTENELSCINNTSLNIEAVTDEVFNNNVQSNDEWLSAVINTLPAIDSDVNANDSVAVANNGNVIESNG